MTEEDQRFVNTFIDLTRAPPPPNIVDFSFRWLDEFGQSRFARFILCPLLYNVKDESVLERLRHLADLWLQQHESREHAAMVENAIIASDEVSSSRKG
jgi:hypothetical protein